MTCARCGVRRNVPLSFIVSGTQADGQVQNNEDERSVGCYSKKYGLRTTWPNGAFLQIGAAAPV